VSATGVKTCRDQALGLILPLARIVDQAVRSGVVLEVCEQSCAIIGLKKQDLMDEASIVGAPVLNDRILDAEGVLSF
jgi:predicted peroxiredoxin